MHTLEAIDSALQWETERQNRLHQQAVERKQGRDEAGMKSVGADGAPQAAPAAVPATEKPDYVRQVPDMRSALIPLDEQAEGGDWSKPFSLLKADMEPWLSFLEGYGRSRLFLGAHSDTGVQLDFAVRALLELKGLSPSLILEPPVQINRQVEYHDFEDEPAADRRRGDMLLRLAQETHARQLAKAVEQGRQLGDSLYDAMMGEGYANLVKAWERRHGRKPTVEELHAMLSTGRVRVERRRAPATPAIPPEERAMPRPRPITALPPLPPASAPAEPAQTPARAPAASPRPMPVIPVIESESEDVLVQIGTRPAKASGNASAAGGSERQSLLSRRIGLYLLHGVATVCSGAAIAYFWLI